MTKQKLVLFFLIALLFSGCVKRIALNSVADALSSGESSVFTGDNDPEFLGDALPFALKLQESILEQSPKHKGIHLATTTGFCSYAYAYLAFPADTMSDDYFDQKQHLYKRAKKMYLRARDYGIKGLSIKYPNFMEGLQANADSTLERTKKEDCDLLYWTALSWMGAFTVDKFDMTLAVSAKLAQKMLFRVEALNPDYGDGSLDEFFVSYYGGMPVAMGGSPTKARLHFDRAVALSDTNSAGPYIALATTISINQQNLSEFRDLLKKAESILPEDDEKNLLLRTLHQQKARWLLAHEEDFFLIDE